MFNRGQKLILGVTILIIVDVIWVSSSELTKFLYENENFDKPFFCTYFKTAMFTIYLVMIGLITPWKDTCDRRNVNYSIMEQSSDADENYHINHSSLSDPTFIPIQSNNGDTNGDGISGTESDDSSVRSVRFSKMAEVREMSANEATEALMARLSYSASIRMKRHKTHHRTAKTALLFCILWFVANYLFQISLELTETAVVTILCSTSSLFALILAAMFPSSTGGDKFTISKLIAVAMNIGGVIIISANDIHSTRFTRGASLALISAFFYAAYLVFAKRKTDNEGKIDILLFFGFVGLWSLILMWPIFFILNFTKIEKFELPNQKQFGILIINGLVGTVISEVLWLWGCFLTSSLIGTIAMSMQVPLSILFDVMLKRKHYSSIFYMGSIAIFLAIMLVILLISNDDSDPLMRIFKISYRKLCRCKKNYITRLNDHEQHESLINTSD